MIEHEHFEELCALVASGLASAEEIRRLQNHLQSCAECRDSFGNLAQIGAGILAARSDRNQRLPGGMTGRFVTRAITEGIPLRQPITLVPAWASRHLPLWGGVLAAGMMFLLLSTANLKKLSSPTTSYQKEVAVHSRVSVSTAGPTTSDNVTPVTSDLSDDAMKRLQASLNAANADRQNLVKQLADLNDQIKAKTSSDRDLSAKVSELENLLGQIKQQSIAKDAQIADLSNQMKQNEAHNTDQLASLVESQFQIRKLSSQLSERDARIQDQHQLLTAGSQARDLIIARNLHIIDVHDNNGLGRQQQKAFGRIFYTEGKQIIFYAYDLENGPHLKKDVTFYVWGGQLGNEHAIKNLGIFRNDDAGAGRWILTFDDPHVLAQINTVFVTAESKRDVALPNGKQILFAYLGDKPNHP